MSQHQAPALGFFCYSILTHHCCTSSPFSGQLGTSLCHLYLFSLSYGGVMACRHPLNATYIVSWLVLKNGWTSAHQRHRRNGDIKTKTVPVRGGLKILASGHCPSASVTSSNRSKCLLIDLLPPSTTPYAYFRSLANAPPPPQRLPHPPTRSSLHNRVGTLTYFALVRRPSIGQDGKVG